MHNQCKIDNNYFNSDIVSDDNIPDYPIQQKPLAEIAFIYVTPRH